MTSAADAAATAFMQVLQGPISGADPESVAVAVAAAALAAAASSNRRRRARRQPRRPRQPQQTVQEVATHDETRVPVGQMQAEAEAAAEQEAEVQQEAETEAEPQTGNRRALARITRGVMEVLRTAEGHVATLAEIQQQVPQMGINNASSRRRLSEVLNILQGINMIEKIDRNGQSCIHLKENAVLPMADNPPQAPDTPDRRRTSDSALLRGTAAEEQELRRLRLEVCSLHRQVTDYKRLCAVMEAHVAEQLADPLARVRGKDVADVCLADQVSLLVSLAARRSKPLLPNVMAMPSAVSDQLPSIVARLEEARPPPSRRASSSQGASGSSFVGRAAMNAAASASGARPRGLVSDENTLASASAHSFLRLTSVTGQPLQAAAVVNGHRPPQLSAEFSQFSAPTAPSRTPTAKVQLTTAPLSSSAAANVTVAAAAAAAAASVGAPVPTPTPTWQGADATTSTTVTIDVTPAADSAPFGAGRRLALSSAHSVGVGAGALSDGRRAARMHYKRSEAASSSALASPPLQATKDISKRAKIVDQAAQSAESSEALSLPAMLSLDSPPSKDDYRRSLAPTDSIFDLYGLRPQLTQ